MGNSAYRERECEQEVTIVICLCVLILLCYNAQTEPHTLVWARMRGYPPWPAKVVREVDDHHIEVRFFGDHERGQIAMSSAHLLSKQIPVLQAVRTPQFEASCRELLTHLKRLRYASTQRCSFTY
jgi:hypothetical protein